MSLINIQEEETSAKLLGSKAKRSRSDFYNRKKVYLNIVTNGLKVEALTTEYTSTPAHMYKSRIHKLLSFLQNFSHCWVSASYSHQYGVVCSLLWIMYLSPPPIKTSKTTIFHSLGHICQMWAKTFDLPQFDIVNSFILRRSVSCLFVLTQVC
jgi:hypothetical protein